MGLRIAINIELKNSNLYAECSYGEKFKLSQAILFDGSDLLPALKINP